MSMTSRKTYKQLCEEREAVLHEAEKYKQGLVYQERIGLWTKSDYLSELLYIRQKIESEIVPHYIVEIMKLHKRLLTRLPMELITLIASFGTSEHQIAAQMVKEGNEATLDVVDPEYKG